MSEKKVSKKKKTTKKITTRRTRKKAEQIEVDPNEPKYLKIEEMRELDDTAKDSEIARLNMAAHDQYVKNHNLELENLYQKVKLKQNEIEKEMQKQRRFADQYNNKKEKYNLLLKEIAEKYNVELKKDGELFYNAQTGQVNE